MWWWNESGFRPPLCTYRLNWARRTSRGWWDDWDDTVLQTQDLKLEPWRSEAEHATSRSRRLPTILTFTRGWGRNICFFQTAETGNRAPNSGVKGSGANYYRPPGVWCITNLLSYHLARDIHPMLFQCWASVEDGGPTLKQHWVNSPCLQGQERIVQVSACTMLGQRLRRWVNNEPTVDDCFLFAGIIQTLLGQILTNISNVDRTLSALVQSIVFSSEVFIAPGHSVPK